MYRVHYNDRTVPPLSATCHDGATEELTKNEMNYEIIIKYKIMDLIVQVNYYD